jgi:hypothetical protein
MAIKSFCKYHVFACLILATRQSIAAAEQRQRHRKLVDTPENALPGKWIVELQDYASQDNGDSIFQTVLNAVHSIPGASVYHMYSNVFPGFAVQGVPDLFLNVLLMNPMIKSISQVSVWANLHCNCTTYIISCIMH